VAETDPRKVEQGKNPSASGLREIGDGTVADISRTAVEETKDAAAQGADQIYGKFALLGTVVGGKKYALAIIEDKELQTQKVYKIGYPISGGVITDILREKIIILLDGRYVIFRIEARTGSGKESVAAKLNEGSKLITVNLRDMLVAFESFKQPMSEAAMVPLSSDPESGPGGFKLQNVEAGSVLHKMGFKNGDVIEEINGNPIGDPFNAVAVYNLLKEVLPEDIFQKSGLDLGSFMNGTDNQKSIILQKVQNLFYLLQKQKDARITLTVKRKGNRL
jgi:type II secretory pathway component PulC